MRLAGGGHSAAVYTGPCRKPLTSTVTRFPIKSHAGKQGDKTFDRLSSKMTASKGKALLQTNPMKTPNSRPPSQFYIFFTGFPFPIGPLLQRKTCRYEVEKDTIWTFEQTQAVENFSVHTPVRMTVIRLKSGGLWVHAPIAPTDECVRLVKELGHVEYIILPTFAYEHKVFVGPFSRKFPKAKVYTNPFQWSLPLNLPSQFFGIFPAGELVSDDKDAPWSDEIEQKLFLPPSIGVTSFVRYSECAFFHKRTRTLLVTDSVIFIDDNVPDAVPREAALELSRDNPLSRFVAGGRSSQEIRAIARPAPVEDTDNNRIRGWRRMSLLVLYFAPSDLLRPDASFEAIAYRLIVPPVVETLVFSKVKQSVRTWVDSIVQDWSFNKVIPCHFAAPVRTTPAEFKRAFSFVYEEDDEAASTSGREGGAAAVPAGTSSFFSSLLLGLSGCGKMTRPVIFPDADIKALKTLNNVLLGLGLVKRNADLKR